MNVGIDLIHFATADFYLGLDEFAQQKNQDPNKYLVGIGQEKMSIAPPDEDVVTLAAKACDPLLAACDSSQITAVFFATESGVDQSKSAGAFLHGLLGLPNRCRVVEFKHACYAGAAALQMAVNSVRANANERILVVAADIARYDVDTSGEATQGCGAVAMLVTANPRILAVEPGSGYYTEDVMDFWRPNHRDTALVDGKYSTKVYLNSLKQAWAYFQEATGRGFADIQHFCYHIPFTKMAEKAHKQLVKLSNVEQTDADTLAQTQPSQIYNRVVGNSYSASLFVGFCSMLDHYAQKAHDLSGDRVGLFSYGSGCVAEFFSGVLQTGYEAHLFTKSHLAQIAQRKPLSYDTYLAYYHQPQPTDANITFDTFHTGPYRLAGIQDHKRYYLKTGA
ncbi:hydroxymethylglutaryl-CoA synthase [Thiomicrospira cyclica]|jgi:hydroxymethylglutaryl-CoA synthase|uniref:Hydroxymethylglutaryl-CoA synthase n=1 Tax=Thiomicrospira cyclica (strain DSM 14477 / JCM 11371 / ALM1) TaxID=717773 RepID=F6DA42_THICA|nr:hydroxymethylglutaryl-CoA synthase [Thiomicrospira cyclica]AEG32173.1 hydroxymethylglutaryl-CoA synthase [Thiomicrospira cyclica ALM1]